MDPFEQSADMRLLELHRKALGKEAPARPNWQAERTDVGDAAFSDEVAPPQLQGARIAVTVSATPNKNLIPGAVVTASIALFNEGTQAAANLKANVPVPHAMRYRAGTFLLDGRPASDDVAEAFFGPGYGFAKLEPGQRVTALWKLDMLAGTEAPRLSPHVTAGGAGVFGAAPISLTRAPKKDAALPLPEKYVAQPEDERPFYELDAEEELALKAGLPSEAATPPEAPLVVMPDLAPADPKPEVVAEAASPELEVEAEPEAAAEQTAPRLYCTIDSASLRMITKLFESGSFGQLPHYSLQNALACTVGASGKELGLQQHFASQNSLLGRALLMRRLGKTVSVAEFSRGDTGFAQLGAVPPVPAGASEPAALFMEITPAEIEFCAPVAELDSLAVFVRLRQLAVALQCRRVAHADVELAARLQDLLERYAAAARSSINRTFVRSKLDPKFDVFGATDAATDALARELIAQLELVL